MNFMKENIKSISLSTLFFSIFIFQIGAHSTSCPADHTPMEISQPDGSELTIVAKGHYRESYTETIDGFTLKKDEDGFFQYAVLDDQGRLKPSGVNAEDPDQRNASKRSKLEELGVEPGLRPEHTERGMPPEDARDKKPEHEELHSFDHEAAKNFPSEGEHNVLMLLIDYPDLEAEYEPERFEDLMNEENYQGIGSFRDFYLENSDGQLNLKTDVFGWFRASHGFKYYAEDRDHVSELIREAIDSAAAQKDIDFSKYDNNNDGELEGIMIVHAGPGAEQFGSRDRFIWSHRSSLGEFAVTHDNTRIDDYGIQPETRGDLNNFEMIGIGVFVHEFGHILGLPDLYDTRNNSSGIGEWGVMGSGTWLNNGHTPSHFVPWSKEDLNWIEPEKLESNQELEIGPSTVNNDHIYKVPVDDVDHEYFYLENRQQTNFDSYLPGSGLAVWHVNETVLEDKRGSNTINTNPSNYGVGLIQADGRRHLENGRNRGTRTDLFPGTEFRPNREFTHFTDPPAELSDGSQAGFSLLDIEEVEENNNVTLRFERAPVAQFLLADNEVCTGVEVSLNNETRHLVEQTWYFGNGDTSDVANPEYAYEEPGEYEITLEARDSEGNTSEYSQEITVNPFPRADFDYELVDGTIKTENNSDHAEEFIWSFGEETFWTDNIEDLNARYGTLDELQLVARTDFRCSDTSSVAVHTPAEEDEIAKAYPNPFQHKINVHFERKGEQERQDFKVRVLRADGEEVKTFEDIAVEENNQNHRFNLASLSPGVYFIEVFDGDHKEYQRVIKN